MSNFQIKPRKRIKHEILSFVPLFVLIGAIFFVFPFQTLATRRLVKDVEFSTEAICEYVELTNEEESWAMDIIRSVISTDISSVRDLRVDLSLSTIPEREHSFIMSLKDRTRPLELFKPALEIITIPKSLQAKDPDQILSEKKLEQKPTFSKEEMLKLID